MKRIARAQGGDTDTALDYEYTDWPAVDAFADAVAHDVTLVCALQLIPVCA